MKNKNKIIYALLSLLSLLVPIGFLLGILEEQVAFPIIFLTLGCQQLFYGFLLASKEKKYFRSISIILGSFFLLFSVFVVFPNYYL